MASERPLDLVQTSLTSETRVSSIPPPDEGAVRHFAAHAKAVRTREEYARDWARFETWCGAAGLCAMPAAPETVALYISARGEQGCTWATVHRELCALSQAHKVAGYASPRTDARVREVAQGIRRERSAKPNVKAPLLVEDLRRIVAALPATLAGSRDRALLLLGFSGAFRRSELASLRVQELEFRADEIIFRSERATKTTLAGEPIVKRIEAGSSPDTCPVEAVRAWLKASEVVSGPLLRRVDRLGRLGRPLSGHAIASIVKRRAAAVGLDVSNVSSHSLRAGFVTQARVKGLAHEEIADQTGHRSLETVRRYDRRSVHLKSRFSKRIGL